MYVYHIYYIHICIYLYADIRELSLKKKEQLPALNGDFFDFSYSVRELDKALESQNKLFMRLSNWFGAIVLIDFRL